MGTKLGCERYVGLIGEEGFLEWRKDPEQQSKNA